MLVCITVSSLSSLPAMPARATTLQSDGATNALQACISDPVAHARTTRLASSIPANAASYALWDRSLLVARCCSLIIKRINPTVNIVNRSAAKITAKIETAPDCVCCGCMCCLPICPHYCIKLIYGAEFKIGFSIFGRLA